MTERYVVTVRMMFDLPTEADQFMQAMDTHNFGEIAREITLEEV